MHSAHGYLPGGKGSQKALQAILSREARKIPGVQWPRTRTGKFSTSKDALADLAAQVPFLDLLFRFNAVSKLKGTFLDKLADYGWPHGVEDR